MAKPVGEVLAPLAGSLEERRFRTGFGSGARIFSSSMRPRKPSMSGCWR
jgi:hypothetical protein